MHYQKFHGNIVARATKVSLVGIVSIAALSGCGGGGGGSQSAPAIPTSYTVTDLGSFRPASINDSGIILGSLSASSQTSGLWQNGTIKPITPSGSSTIVLGNTGELVCQTPSAPHTGWSEPFILRNGVTQNLNLPDNLSAWAHNINSSNVIAGEYTTLYGPSGYGFDEYQENAFTYSAGVATKLPPLPDFNSGVAEAINDQGMVAGYSAYVLPPAGVSRHAVAWINGKVTDLGTLGGSDSTAYAINNHGVVVGDSEISASFAQHAFQWQNGKMTDLPPLQPAVDAYAVAINDAGVVVGHSDYVTPAGRGQITGTIWINGKPQDINKLVHLPAGETILAVADINSAGQMVAEGLRNDTIQTAYLLTPQR